jgi:hypothetical protein
MRWSGSSCNQRLSRFTLIQETAIRESQNETALVVGSGAEWLACIGKNWPNWNAANKNRLGAKSRLSPFSRWLGFAFTHSSDPALRDIKSK